MRTKLLTFLFMAGTVVGCASNPPPPPPMAEAPPPAPAPAPAPMGPMAGLYRGTPELAADAPASCAKMSRPVSVRVARNNTFVLGGMRGSVGPDGSVTSRGGRNMSMMGMASASGLEITQMRGQCSYRYMLTKS